MLAKFRDVYEKMHSALDGMPYAELAISDEVKEQVRSNNKLAPQAGMSMCRNVSISVINSFRVF